jgi:predicted ATPase
VTVVGAAGVGKSRLVAEFLSALDGAHVLQGHCLSYGDGITYWPVVEVVKQLEPRLEELVPDRRALEILTGLLGSDREVSLREEIAWAVRRLLESAASEQPLVCVLDDVNWGEETFLDLVEQVTALARDVPLLVVCMARPDLLDRRPGWGGSLNAANILLEPLSDRETDVLIERLLAETALEPVLRERIREAAEGNPLFVEEMIAMLRASEGEIAVPASIQALLASRLDQLEPGERRVLECGAVEGRLFHQGALEALLAGERRLGSLLASLVRKDLVRPATPQLPDEEAYRFRHVLIRDAAYDALPKANRAQLHERFADWLDARSTAIPEAEEVVGYHLLMHSRWRLARVGFWRPPGGVRWPATTLPPRSTCSSARFPSARTSPRWRCGWILPRCSCSRDSSRPPATFRQKLPRGQRPPATRRGGSAPTWRVRA